MKKITGILFAICLLSQACSKKNHSSETSGELINGASIAVDGPGTYIKVDGTGETIVPDNPPAELSNGSFHVAFEYIQTGKTAWICGFNPNCPVTPVIHLTSIRKL